MRRTFADLLYERMKQDSNIVVITADLGYMVWDKVKEDFPDRFINCGSAEQLMVCMAVGMTYEGKIPICYSITPFLLYRPFEMIRNYLNGELAPVKLVGCGRDREYEHNGPTHWAEDQWKVVNILDNIDIFFPQDKKSIDTELLHSFIYNGKPSYLSLSKN